MFKFCLMQGYRSFTPLSTSNFTYIIYNLYNFFLLHLWPARALLFVQYSFLLRTVNTLYINTTGFLFRTISGTGHEFPFSNEALRNLSKIFSVLMTCNGVIRSEYRSIFALKVFIYVALRKYQERVGSRNKSESFVHAVTRFFNAINALFMTVC